MGKKVLFQISLNKEDNSVDVEQFIASDSEMMAFVQTFICIYKKLAEDEDFQAVLSAQSKEDVLEELLKQQIDNYSNTTIINS